MGAVAAVITILVVCRIADRLDMNLFTFLLMASLVAFITASILGI